MDIPRFDRDAQNKISRWFFSNENVFVGEMIFDGSGLEIYKNIPGLDYRAYHRRITIEEATDQIIQLYKKTLKG